MQIRLRKLRQIGVRSRYDSRSLVCQSRFEDVPHKASVAKFPCSWQFRKILPENVDGVTGGLVSVVPAHSLEDRDQFVSRVA
jgi:hypothetical protein